MQTTTAHDLKTQEGIKSFLQEVAQTEPLFITPFQRKVTYRALRVVYSNQTADEQMAQATAHNNGTGFNGTDAQILSDVAEGAEKYQSLTGKQARFVARKLVKYSRQIAAAVKPAPAPPQPAPVEEDPEDAAHLAELEADLAAQRIDKKAQKRAYKEGQHKGHRKPHQIGLDGLTDSERAFSGVLVAYGCAPMTRTITPYPCGAI